MELTNIQGGGKYFEYTWSNTNNPLIYTAEAVGNGAKAVANGVILLFN
ncbi:hypothetical protein J5U18_03335 [Sphingobacteriaceae bacterium WQ 2009]|uniref:Uncharacterized protein n=1 Tax=Rhinopithecimicrobium faecis TaxID=2820698 RepID=A0A8T4H8L1_9SPHI|nr:hypothetical protein [Sphingobacteriaceae bacterium WQ 2009]